MANNEQITKELEAIICLTAKRTVDEALKAYDKKMEDKIEIHRLTCQVGKLGAFKATAIGIFSGIAALLGKWFLEKL